MQPRKIMRKQKTEKTQPNGRYVYGIAGICTLFDCSPSTARRYKDGFLRQVIIQRGRKILVDAEKAIELFNEDPKKK